MIALRLLWSIIFPSFFIFILFFYFDGYNLEYPFDLFILWVSYSLIMSCSFISMKEYTRITYKGDYLSRDNDILKSFIKTLLVFSVMVYIMSYTLQLMFFYIAIISVSISFIFSIFIGVQFVLINVPYTKNKFTLKPEINISNKIFWFVTLVLYIIKILSIFYITKPFVKLLLVYDQSYVYWGYITYSYSAIMTLLYGLYHKFINKEIFIREYLMVFVLSFIFIGFYMPTSAFWGHILYPNIYFYFVFYYSILFIPLLLLFLGIKYVFKREYYG